jgi:hypothetical protein
MPWQSTKTFAFIPENFSGGIKSEGFYHQKYNVGFDRGVQVELSKISRNGYALTGLR